MEKKRKWILAAVLAVIALFCLWYTRPISTEQVMDGMPVNNFSGILNVAYVENGLPHIDMWKLEDGLNSSHPEYHEMLDILKQASFRTHLRNLLGNWYSSTHQWDGTGSAYLLFSDGEDKCVTLHIDQRTLIIDKDWDTRSYVYSLCDQHTMQDITALFQKYGTFQNE